MSLVPTLYCAAFLLNPLPDRQWQLLSPGALAIDGAGKILAAGSAASVRELLPNLVEVDLGARLLLPGFIDTHVHLPQYHAAGIGTGELLEWLQTYIFPLEARFGERQFAQARAKEFFRDALSVGTTTLSVYCSSHYEATDVAFEAALQAGLRVCMGKTMMDRGAPEALLSTASTNMQESLKLAARWHGAAGGRLQYTLTPRFAGSCSRELMQRCGEVAQAEGLRVQTHLAENPSELAYIAALFPEAASYTQVYHQYGLLGDRTLLAHAIYLDAAEQAQLQQANCAIAHCPTSNRFLQSGVMPLRHYLESGFRLGLGCDVAGGYSLSLLNEAREAAESSKTWNLLHSGSKLPPVTAAEALWLATLGGAQALGLDAITGSFAPGKEADFLVLDLTGRMPAVPLEPNPELLAARLVYCTPTNPVQKVFVQGQPVFEV